MNKKSKITDFYEAWWFLKDHPSFMGQFYRTALSVDVVKVSPKSNIICLDKRKNTKTQVWLECGATETYENPSPSEKWTGYISTHDVALDCGADTFEEAIIKLANLVLKQYGDYTPEE